MTDKSSAGMQWIDVKDDRFEWLNVAGWEARGDGVQPVRVPKVWRDKWPQKTARRGMSSAGMAVRFHTDSKQLVFRVTFVDVPDSAPSTPAAGWERSRPNFFSLYRDGIVRVVRQRRSSDANLHLADGLAMVHDPLFLLVTDRVHPNDAGMHRIAEGGAAALKPLLSSPGP